MSLYRDTLLNKTTSKRKRNDTLDLDIDTTPFEIRSDSTHPFDQSLTLTPAKVLPRAALPLSFLDLDQSGPRLFLAHIQVLESSHDHEIDGQILLAHDELHDRLYAIERVAKRRYALCRLARSITAENVLAKRIGDNVTDSRDTKRRSVATVQGHKLWWCDISISVPTQALNSTLDGAISKVSEECTAEDTPKFDVGKNCSGGSAEPLAQDTDKIGVLDHAPAGFEDKTSNSLQELNNHYLEMLYMSRTSLAYFSKGPLSRARTVFATKATDTAPFELIDHLRNLLQQPSAMEKKYKSSIPELLKDTAGNLSEAGRKPRKRRKWKAKRDKAGFLFEEQDFVRKWWDDSNKPHAHDELQSINIRLTKLRSRETFLQIILILEVLALEAACPGESAIGMPGDGKSQQNQGVDLAKPRKAKKMDLPTLLETLLDNLCIWYSLEGSSPVKREDSSLFPTGEAIPDQLKDFCIEVIIPFYVRRVPQHANTVNRKLGGPTAPTPVKRKLFVSSKPGEARPRSNPKKIIQKKAVDSATEAVERATPPVPSLNRSFTDPEHGLRIKRESSEFSLASIPAADLTRPARQQRRSLMHSMSFNRREVDLNALSRANEAKARKKAEIYAKMQEAISNIKKPNRALAIQEVAESTDESFARATTKSRLSSNQKAKGTNHSMQVASTPKHPKTGRGSLHIRDDFGKPQPESTFVPSSSTKPTGPADITSSVTFAIPQTGHRPRYHAPSAIGETPSRGFAKYMPVSLARQPGTLDNSPADPREKPTAAAVAAIQQTPSRRLDTRPALFAEQDSEILATPLPRAVEDALVHLSPNATRLAGRAYAESPVNQSKSLYASLGWDEEEYEELA